MAIPFIGGSKKKKNDDDETETSTPSKSSRKQDVLAALRMSSRNGNSRTATAGSLGTEREDSTSSVGKLQQELLRTEGGCEAEDAIISKIEERGRHTLPTADGFRPAVEGERAPLDRVDTLGRAFGEPKNQNTEHGKPATASTLGRLQFSQVAQRVLKAQRLASAKRDVVGELSANRQRTVSSHRRAHSLLNQIDEEVDSDSEADGEEADVGFRNDTFGLRKQPGMKLTGIDQLLDDSDRTSEDDYSSTSSYDDEHNDPDSAAGESLPLLYGASSDGSYTDLSTVAQRRSIAKKFKAKAKFKKVIRALNPMNMLKNMCKSLSRSLLLLAIPLFVTAWILFYYVSNPDLDFLPGHATVSWWLNFIGRQLLLLELSRIIQFIVMDCVLLSSRYIAKILGPWITIFCLQAKGWPMVVGCWGILSMVLLHGDNDFQQHWLHFTGLEIYSAGNSGSYILASETYLRLLVCMVLASVMTTFKRTLVTLYFGKRNFGKSSACTLHTQFLSLSFS